MDIGYILLILLIIVLAVSIIKKSVKIAITILMIGVIISIIHRSGVDILPKVDISDIHFNNTKTGIVYDDELYYHDVRKYTNFRL